MKKNKNDSWESDHDFFDDISYTVGVPPKFRSKKVLMHAINDYFKNGIRKRHVVIKQSGDSISIPVPTITGLCLHLGFASRQSFYDYEKDPRFSYIMKRAKLFIEREYEELLQHGNVAGAIFALKNFGWKDTVENTVIGDSKKPLKWTVELIEAGPLKLENSVDE